MLCDMGNQTSDVTTKQQTHSRGGEPRSEHTGEKKQNLVSANLCTFHCIGTASVLKHRHPRPRALELIPVPAQSSLLVPLFQLKSLVAAAEPELFLGPSMFLSSEQYQRSV